MTKKDYVLIAKAINQEVVRLENMELDYKYDSLSLLRGLGQTLCNELRKDNSQFDSSKFLTTCGL